MQPRAIVIITVRWIILEPNSGAIASLRRLLDTTEQARADRFRFAADRDAYIAAHAMLRMTLSRATGIEAANLRFRVDKNDKPILDPDQGPRELHFSLSHTRGLAACAIGQSHLLGIDAEAWTTHTPTDIAEHYFSPAEARLVTEKTGWERKEAFFRLWTLKEAYLKATGQGLTIPLDSFAFDLDPLAISLEAPETGSAWRFAEFRPGPRHTIALAVRSLEPIAIDAAALAPLDTSLSERDLGRATLC